MRKLECLILSFMEGVPLSICEVEVFELAFRKLILKIRIKLYCKMRRKVAF